MACVIVHGHWQNGGARNLGMGFYLLRLTLQIERWVTHMSHSLWLMFCILTPNLITYTTPSHTNYLSYKDPEGGEEKEE